ncbi:MAG: hypothetical protein KGI91_15455 [Burkholderiales bacterium]|nr:hypothetical protein [Burkholderiales bacterium]MDE2078441.1 hypothetical protein [Burkholderiales bacterium]MDE2433987.1 hypothetical protein [Burkholderiales bacterium]
MTAPRRPTPSSPHLAGKESPAWRPSWVFVLIGLGLAVGGLSYIWHATSESEDRVASTATPAPQPAGRTAPEQGSAWPWSMQSAPVSQPTPAPQASASSAPIVDGEDPTPDLSSYVPRGAKPTMNEVIDRLHQAGIHTGLAAFNPPGTRPPLIGLAVPEDFVLPDGYVRHYQATDDGQRIEPILMFAPDRQFFDANHQPIKIPENRVVPPELAPPGMPIRRIVIPAPLQPETSGP